MSTYIFTTHARDMLKERNILEQWVLQALDSPEDANVGNDGNMHYFRSIPECENRVLHVVVNEFVEPNRIITVFFDRRRRNK